MIHSKNSGIQDTGGFTKNICPDTNTLSWIGYNDQASPAPTDALIAF